MESCSKKVQLTFKRMCMFAALCLCPGTATGMPWGHVQGIKLNPMGYR